MEISFENGNDPLKAFGSWFEAMVRVSQFEPTVMSLATQGVEGGCSLRQVLLKKYDSQGFYFFTNYRSRKSREIFKSPNVALGFHWEKPYHRQVRVQGVAQKISREESQTYFASRSRGSQLGAWASPQSEIISDREVLEKRAEEMEKRFLNRDVPCPEHWGGFVVRPTVIEFWQSREFRLHDRFRFHRGGIDGDWKMERLAP